MCQLFIYNVILVNFANSLHVIEKKTMARAGVSAKWDNDYDPHENRDIEHGLTNYEALMNLIKGCIGTGIFALPEAFCFAGMVNGTIGFLLISLFSIYCLHVMIRCQYHLCKYKKIGVMTYADSMELGFQVGPECLQKYSRLAWHATNIIFILSQFGVLCVYVIFVSQHLKSIGDEYTAKPIYLYLYTIMVTIPFALITCVKNLKIFTFFSLQANIITVATLGMLAYYISSNLPSLSSRSAFGEDVRHYFLAFGTTFFSMQVVPIVAGVENVIKDGKRFTQLFGALNVGLGIVTVLYMIFGFMGYWKYGKGIQSSITLNLPHEDILYQAISALYCMALIISYGLQGIICITILWNCYLLPRLLQSEISDKKLMIYNYILRIGTSILSITVSLNIPYLGPIISLVGGICLSTVGVMFPAILEICTLWPDGFGKFKWIFWKDLTIFSIGIFTLVSSTYASLSVMIVELSLRSSFEI